MDMENFAGSWKFFCGYVYVCTNGRYSLHLWHGHMVTVSWVNISLFAFQPQKFYPPEKYPLYGISSNVHETNLHSILFIIYVYYLVYYSV